VAMPKISQSPPSVAHHDSGNSTNLKVEQSSAVNDDLSRNVYGVLGLSLDAIDFPSLLRSLEKAVENASPFLISTPNVNFLIASQNDKEFRESILQSNMCLVD
jgi:N-acetylglucosaminyldiphosphoundecaprenol N-acetyl-beta-D-mannosaminyltransferase